MNDIKNSSNNNRNIFNLNYNDKKIDMTKYGRVAGATSY
jgi:hypothetical protein